MNLTFFGYSKLNNFMRKILLTLVAFVSVIAAAWAQPSIVVGSGTGTTGNQVTIDVSVKDFTNMYSVESAVFTWDEAILQFDQVTNINLTGLNIGDFTLNAGGDSLRMDWVFHDCETDPDAAGLNIPDDQVIFQIEYTILGGYGAQTDVVLADQPFPQFKRTNSSCQNIQYFAEDGGVTVGVLPVTLTGSNETGNAGDFVCVDFTFSNFVNMQSAQFALTWDTDFLQAEPNPIVGDVPNTTLAFFNVTPANGTLTCSWQSPPGEAVTVDDGTLFFTQCFTIVGDCEESSTIAYDITSQTFGDFHNNVEENVVLPFSIVPGSVEANDCDPIGLQLFADCGDAVEINEEFCVPVTVGPDFSNVSDLSYLMQWNSAILTYTGVQNINGGTNVPGFNNGSFNAANADNGILAVSWEANPPFSGNLNNGDLLYEVCFEVTGLGGNSPISFSNPSEVRIGNGPNIGINGQNCVVEVTQPDSVAMVVADGAALPGDEVCVSVTAINFNDVTSYQFTLGFEPLNFNFTQITNINIPGATAANFNTAGAAGGFIFFENYSQDPGATMNDNDVMFDICFEAVGAPGDCSEITLQEIPLVGSATTGGSNGENVGIRVTPGELCVLYPEGFGLDISEVTAGWMDTTCVAISVNSFDNITDTEFCLSWDATNITYVNFTSTGVLPGFGAINFDPQPGGVMCIDWESPDGNPVNIPDNSTIFELCYAMDGTPENCYPIQLQEGSTVNTSNGPGSILGESGEICMEDQFFIVDTLITPVSCIGECDGQIQISVIHGTDGAVGNTWLSDPQQFTPLMAENLCEGEISVVLYDFDNFDLLDTFTFMIPMTEDIPMADAGTDTVIDCGTNFAQLSGTGTEGADYSSQWYDVNGAPIGVGGSALASAAGNYVFEVTNTTTGCSVTDTVFVDAPVGVNADAGTDVVLNCPGDVATLDGSASDQGVNILYTWTVVSGADAIINSGETTLMPEIMGAGIYQIEVRDTVTNCTETATVEVTDSGFEVPMAEVASDTIQMGCDNNATLMAVQDTVTIGLTYTWEDETGTVVGMTPMAQIGALGTYYLIVANDLTGCSTRDTMVVVPTADFPQLTTTPDTAITCDVTEIQLSAQYDETNPNYIFEWNLTGGASFQAGTENSNMPIALTAGFYEAVLTDTAMNCVTNAIITVDDLSVDPMVDAGADLALTCSVASDTLNGSNSATGATIQYTWTDADGVVVGNDITLVVDAAGTYQLEVVDSATGCSATDEAVVTFDGVMPVVDAATQDFVLNCANTELTLPTPTVTPAGAYTYNWAGPGIVGSNTADTLLVNVAGTYDVTVTDADGCSGTGSFEVTEDMEEPIANAGDDMVITCATTSVTLDASTSTPTGNLNFIWTNVVDGEVPTPNDQATVTVSTGGTYEVTVINTTNMCSATDVVVVTYDTIAPTATIATPEEITCQMECVDLVATTSSTDFTVTWTTVSGTGTPNPTDALTTSVCEEGEYMVTIIDNITGCEASEMVTVTADNEMPVIQFEQPTAFDCDDTSVLIDATATGNLADFSSVTWTGPGAITPPSNSLTVSVDAPGDYELTVVSAANGCTTTETITVDSAQDLPVANAGDDMIIECGETLSLDGSGSDQGADFTYEWTTVSGEPLGGDINGLMPTTTGEGTYMLQVTNTATACTNTDEVTITLELPPAATVMDDISICSDEIELTANQPAGTDGVWTVTTLSNIEDNTANVTNATNLQAGDNIFTWTLSAPGCPNYSNASVTVTSDAGIVANNDILNLEAGVTSASLDLIANDILTGGYTMTITTAPTLGTVDSLVNGVLYYSVGVGTQGETELEYEICSEECPDACTTATVLITIESDGQLPEEPNTITPNGDGLNETLTFNILRNNDPELFPDNSIIIFNRWGDIIFEQTPYTNDWDGKSTTGDELPQGTYYYILRLNIAKGDILRGDVTIIK